MCWSTWLSFDRILGSLSLSLSCLREAVWMTSDCLRDGNLNLIRYSDRMCLLITVYGKPFVHNLLVKGEGHSKKAAVLSLPITRKHSAFPLTEVPTLECLLSWWNLPRVKPKTGLQLHLVRDFISVDKKYTSVGIGRVVQYTPIKSNHATGSLDFT